MPVRRSPGPSFPDIYSNLLTFPSSDLPGIPRLKCWVATAASSSTLQASCSAASPANSLLPTPFVTSTSLSHKTRSARQVSLTTTRMAAHLSTSSPLSPYLAPKTSVMASPARSALCWVSGQPCRAAKCDITEAV